MTRFLPFGSRSRVIQVNTLGGAAVGPQFQVDTDGTLTTGLLSYYKLEDANDFYSTRNLTSAGTVTYPAGKVNNGAYYSTTNEYLEYVGSTGISASSDWSVSYWAKNNGSDTSFNSLFEMVYGNGTRNFLFTRDGSNNRWFAMTGQFANVITPSQSISNSTYYHIMTVNSGGTIEIFINNSSIGTIPVGGAISATEALYIGKRYDEAGWRSAGYYDELGIWNKALSTQERTDLYNGGNGQTMVIS